MGHPFGVGWRSLSRQIELDKQIINKYPYKLYRLDINQSIESKNIVPVIFIHGNRGRYTQARFLSSSVSNRYGITTIYRVFTIDFNEEPCAYSGELLLRQLNFLQAIVGIFHKSIDVEAVHPLTLVGHSYGGILAKIVMSDTVNGVHAINRVIALSSPLISPAIDFDNYMSKVYRHYPCNSEINGSRLLNRSAHSKKLLISIHGTYRDFQIPQYLSNCHNLKRLYPQQDESINMIFILTTTIPKLSKALDHTQILRSDYVLIPILNKLHTFNQLNDEKELQEIMRMFAPEYKLVHYPSLSQDSMITEHLNSTIYYQMGDEQIKCGLYL
ncbi:hypothetical protein GJ496_007513 [Pomphorhynchus laevis]|nr:hypothetical protein GJ496_007513 [Pomphorhynchus laevis]